VTQEEKPHQRKKRKGKVNINNELCKGCGFCAGFCSKGVFVMSKGYGDKGYHYPQIEKDVCVACFTCEMMCPDFAIYVEKL